LLRGWGWAGGVALGLFLGRLGFLGECLLYQALDVGLEVEGGTSPTMTTRVPTFSSPRQL
jgi:hypothetical protein